MATKVEAMARALALDRKEAAERIAAVERRVAEGITLVHRVEDDLTKRADRGTRDQLRMIQELRTLIEATDHKHGRQIEQVVALARSLVGDLEESQERRRRQVEDIVRMEIQVRLRMTAEVSMRHCLGVPFSVPAAPCICLL